jgi:hypothetical protein
VKVLAALLMLTTILNAQFGQQQGSIQGVLTDSSGAALAGVTVSLASEGLRRSVQTAADGRFALQGLSGNSYVLKIDSPGLEGFEQRVTVAPGEITRVPIQLRLRVATQAVTVTSDRGPELSLDPGATVGLQVKDSDLDALPDNPNDLRDMLIAMAGPGQVQIYVDGFIGGQVPQKSAIKEIRINQDQFAADRDNYWGGIDITTKAGGEKLHGSAGLTESDAAFNSRNPYAENKADYMNRMFMADVGDSFKNRLSWTLNFYQNTINNTALIDAVTLDPATLAETPVRSTVVVPRNDVSVSGRLDYQFSASNSLMGSYRFLRSDKDNNGVGAYSLVSRGYASSSNTSELHLMDTAILSTRVVTDTRFGYTRTGLYQNGDTSTPSLMVAGAFNGGSAQTGKTSDVNTMFELRSTTSVVRGTHTFKFGFRLRYNPITDVLPSNYGGTFSFFGVTNAPVLDANNQPLGSETAPITSLEQYRRTLLFESVGYPAALIRSLGGGASQFSIAAGNPMVRFSQTDLGVYINDEWRARPNLTISYGFRYDVQTNISDWRDLQPRLGLAWSPGAKKNGTSKTVLRVGSGLFYYRVYPQLTEEALRFNGTKFSGTTEQQYVVLNPDFYPTIPPAASLAAGQSLTRYLKDPNLRGLQMILTSATVERQLSNSTSVSVMYLDQRTNHMPQTVNINAPLPGTYAAGASVYPYGPGAGNIFQFESGGIQKVKWLEVHLNTKLSSRVSLNAQYLLIDAHNNGGWDTATPSNPYNFQADWGPAAWSGLNNFTLLGTILAPLGIQFSPYLTASSGQPYDLTIGSDLNGDTIANDRPAFATDLSRPSVVITKFGAFDTDPMPGQTIVPHNYLRGTPIWMINLRVSKTFGFGKPKEAPAQGNKGPVQHRYGVNFNVSANNILNHLNQGGFSGSLSSPLFGQSTFLPYWSDPSNNRKVQFGTEFTF